MSDYYVTEAGLVYEQHELQELYGVDYPPGVWVPRVDDPEPVFDPSTHRKVTNAWTVRYDGDNVPVAYGQTWSVVPLDQVALDAIAAQRRYIISPHAFFSRLTDAEFATFESHPSVQVRRFFFNLFVLKRGIYSDDQATAQVRGLLTLIVGAQRAGELLAPMTEAEIRQFGDPKAATVLVETGSPT